MSRSTRIAALFLGVSGALASLPRTAAAEDANGFGEKHQLIVSVDRLMPLLSYSSQSVTTTAGGVTSKVSDSGTSMAFLLGREPSLGVVHTLPRVAFDFTIIRHLTLGGSFAVAFGLGGTTETDTGNPNANRKQDSPRTTIIGFAPRVGYILALGQNFAFWPRAGFAFYSVSTKRSGITGGNPSTTTDNDSIFSLDLDPQFVWTPIQHFFFHAGPLVNIPLTGSRSAEFEQGASSNATKSDLSVFHFGVAAGLGGWFDL